MKELTRCEETEEKRRKWLKGHTDKTLMHTKTSFCFDPIYQCNMQLQPNTTSRRLSFSTLESRLETSSRRLSKGGEKSNKWMKRRRNSAPEQLTSVVCSSVVTAVFGWAQHRLYQRELSRQRRKTLHREKVPAWTKTLQNVLLCSVCKGLQIHRIPILNFWWLVLSKLSYELCL